jgi:hypothetical protein
LLFPSVGTVAHKTNCVKEPATPHTIDHYNFVGKLLIDSMFYSSLTSAGSVSEMYTNFK